MLRSILPRRLKSAQITPHNDTLKTNDVASISKKNIIDQFKLKYSTLKVVKIYDYPRSKFYSLIILKVDNYFIGIIIDKKNTKIYFGNKTNIVELLYDIYLYKQSIWKDIQKNLIYKDTEDTEDINNSSSKLSASHQPRFSIFRKVDKDKSKLISFILKLNYENIFIDKYLINLLYFFEQVEKCNFEKKGYFYNTYCNIKPYLEKKEEIKEDKLIEYFKYIFDITNYPVYNNIHDNYIKIIIFQYQKIFIGFVLIVNTNRIFMGCNYSIIDLKNCMINKWNMYKYKKDYRISGLANNYTTTHSIQLREASTIYR